MSSCGGLVGVLSQPLSSTSFQAEARLCRPIASLPFCHLLHAEERVKVVPSHAWVTGYKMMKPVMDFQVPVIIPYGALMRARSASQERASKQGNPRPSSMPAVGTHQVELLSQASHGQQQIACLAQCQELPQLLLPAPLVFCPRQPELQPCM